MSVQKNTPNFLKHSGLSFTTIINQTMDLIPDDGALGIYCYLISKPEDWEIRTKELEKRFGKGEEYITKRMNILKSLGLVKVRSIRDVQGKIVQWETQLVNFIDAQSQAPSHKDLHQNPEKPGSGKTRIWKNRVYTNKRSLHIKEKEKKEILSASEDALANLFDIFWKMYPVKKNKMRAMKLWNKKINTEEQALTILKDIEQKKLKDREWLSGYIPHPSTYLSGERWNDEITVQNLSGKSGNSVKSEQRCIVPEWGAGHPTYDSLKGENLRQPSILKNVECITTNNVGEKSHGSEISRDNTGGNGVRKATDIIF